MSKRFLFLFLGVSILINIFQSMESRYSQATPVVPKTVPGMGLSGKVEINSTHLSAGEELIQIIDLERSVVCYGKISSGGASSISCQKSK